MSRTYRERILTAIATAIVAQGAAAQSSQGIQWQIPSVVALDAGFLPDAFTSRCGRELQGMSGWGAYIASAARVSASFSLQADTRAIVSSQSGGCTADEPIAVLGPNLYETRPGWVFAAGTPNAPFLLSTVRAALEVGPRALRTSAKAGGGIVWSGRRIPVVVGSLSTVFGRSARAFYMEFEVAQASVHATQQRDRFRVDSAGTTRISRSVVERTLRPRLVTLRAGIVFRRARR
jgi:hypothetical protein